MSIPADYVPLAVAFVALSVGLLGAALSAVAILQRHRSERRDALWNRSQLAIAMSQSDKSAERELGTRMIKMLLDQDELSDNDADLLLLASRSAMVAGGVEGSAADEIAAIEANFREVRQDAGGAAAPPRSPPGAALDSAGSTSDDDESEGGSDV